MDYGFVQGNKTFKSENAPLITSKEEYNCYLLIADKFSRYLRICLFAKKNTPAFNYYFIS